MQEACREKRNREAQLQELKDCTARIAKEHVKLDAFATGLKRHSEEVELPLSQRAQKQHNHNQMLKIFSEDPKEFHNAYSTVTSALQRVGIDISKLNEKLGVKDASLMKLRRSKLGTKPLTEVRPKHRYARVTIAIPTLCTHAGRAKGDCGVGCEIARRARGLRIGDVERRKPTNMSSQENQTALRIVIMYILKLRLQERLRTQYVYY